MKGKKEKRITHHPKFIVLNQSAQVWCGFNKCKPVFSDNWDEAKPLENDEQFFNLRITADYHDNKFEKHYL
jgi:hypothetical protein